MFTSACKKDQVWQQFTEIDVGGTTRAQCNMCERDVVPAGTALLDNEHELWDAAMTKHEKYNFYLNNFFEKKQYFPIPDCD